MPRQKLEILAPSDRCRNKRTVAPGGRVGVSVGRTSAGSRGGLGSLGGEVWPVSSLRLRGWRRAGPGGDGLRRRAVPGRPGQGYQLCFFCGRFICIYPAYLNNKKTIAEGRRIPISKAVENPTATEIQDVCSAVGLNVFLERNKMYSREWNRDAQYRGRVRVQLKQEDGSLCLVQFPSRKSVMLYVAEMIPKLKTRTQKTGGGDQSLQQGEGSKKGKGKKKK
uniref:Signal recognition particle 19 kDa protein n=1 Tax=Equus asinus TaxID=9793 RepID=A0A9L0IH60_EQUAS|nr:signal recognition particle 19 kDa protein isoform X1 [Equus asinus]